MENLKHTKGEWYYDINSNNGFDIFLKNSFKIIATVLHKDVSYMPNKIEAESNAKLIAAAPDLLEACLFSNMFPITTEREEDLAKEKALKLGWKMDMPLENFAYQLRKNAIKKATT